jgi:hypothetical protein
VEKSFSSCQQKNEFFLRLSEIICPKNGKKYYVKISLIYESGGKTAFLKRQRAAR